MIPTIGFMVTVFGVTVLAALPFLSSQFRRRALIVGVISLGGIAGLIKLAVDLGDEQRQAEASATQAAKVLYGLTPEGKAEKEAEAARHLSEWLRKP